MKFSIVIPSFNQAEFLEETLLSALDQPGVEKEIIVIDGGSTDGSVDILKRYSHRLAYWISESDSGQTDAINKGLRRITGDVWSYLNSDDLLLPGALKRVAEVMMDPAVAWVGGVSDVIEGGESRGTVAPRRPGRISEYLTPWERESQYVVPCSNVSFMRRSLIDRIGVFDETYDFCMDIEYYVRAVFRAECEPVLLNDVLGQWRWHSQSKTMKTGLWFGFRSEEVRIAKQYLSLCRRTEQARVECGIRREEKSVAVREASYLRHKGQVGGAFRHLVAEAVRNPSLLAYRPWLSTMFRVCLLRKGTLALDH